MSPIKRNPEQLNEFIRTQSKKAEIFRKQIQLKKDVQSVIRAEASGQPVTSSMINAVTSPFT